MPAFVRDRMQQHEQQVAEDVGKATIIFCDIQDFDKIIVEYSSKELIGLLDKVYNAFDVYCEQHGLQKIETVGKTYMAAAGLKATESQVNRNLLSKDHTWRVVDYAFDILQYVK